MHIPLTEKIDEESLAGQVPTVCFLIPWCDCMCLLIAEKELTKRNKKLGSQPARELADESSYEEWAWRP